MSPSKDLQEQQFEIDSSLESSSKLSRKDRQVTEKLRPPNAFLLYRSEKQSTLRKRLNAPLPHDISRIVSLWWHEAPPETKEYYRSLSKINAARHVPSTVVSTGKLNRTPRTPKVPKQQLLSMGQLRVTLPRYLKFVREANDAIRPTCVSKNEILPSSSPTAFPPTPYRSYASFLFPIQHIVCHCPTCEIPISSIAKAIAEEEEGEKGKETEDDDVVDYIDDDADDKNER